MQLGPAAHMTYLEGRFLLEDISLKRIGAPISGELTGVEVDARYRGDGQGVLGEDEEPCCDDHLCSGG